MTPTTGLSSSVAVIGAGIAGSEAALVLAQKGVGVRLFEMRPGKMTPAHATGLPAELVCSNSFKSQVPTTSHGLLKDELSVLGSPLLQIAHATAVPAGTALAVDRCKFSMMVAERIRQEKLVSLVQQEVDIPPEGFGAVIIAAGPLASDHLTAWLARECSAAALHFYDAIAPIIAVESIDMGIAFTASRHQEGSGDYLNCPFTEEEYRAFYSALREADRTTAHAFEDERFFEACLPVEVIAQRGEMALAFGPLKPIGLVDPGTGRRPFAICQLRKENVEGTSYNMVGFQTRLTIPEQRRVFRMIPGLAKAEFLRPGSIHRNTYLDSPELLSSDLSLRSRPSIFLAGQLCGSEGYTESLATGHLAALFACARIDGREIPMPPRESAIGSLLRHVTGSTVKPYTPSNIHFGLLPALPENAKRIRKKANREKMCERAVQSIREWVTKVT